MTSAGREQSHVAGEPVDEVETIAANYLRENGDDPNRALRRIIADALADLLEFERRSRRSDRLISRGYVRGFVAEGR
jgi:hypothetical protein